MSVLLALSTLCENPQRRTGLTTLFQELVRQALVEFPEVRWLVFAGPEQEWNVRDPRVEVCRDFPANDRLVARLWADHVHVGPEARRRGAAALLTVGFVPWRAPLPVAMQVITLHHQGKAAAKTGKLRATYRATALQNGLRRAGCVIANSEWTAAQLRAGNPSVAAKLITSYEGLAHEQFFPPTDASEAARVREKFEIECGYLLWSGNFYPYKQAEKLLAAYARLTPALRERAPLVLAGGDWGGGRAQAEQVARTLGLEGSVKFLGWVGDEWLAPLYRQARAHVLPSAEETFGKSVPEAMACGCPCIVNDIEILREVAGGAARVVNFDDGEASASALTEIISDEARAAQLRVAGLKRAADFSYARLARERVGAVLAMLEAKP